MRNAETQMNGIASPIAPKAPIATKLGIDLVWFGVLVGINLQTSFMTPPFGFALFYLRSVAPSMDRTDPETGVTVRGVSTGDIYLGSLPFVLVQVAVMALIIAFPAIVIGGGDDDKVKFDRAAIERELRELKNDSAPDAAPDPMQQLLESMKREAK